MNRATFLKRGLALALAPSLAKLAPAAPAAAPAAPAQAVVGQYNFISITRAGPLMFKVGDVLRNEHTGENMLVKKLHPHGLTVDRGFGAIKAAAGPPPPLKQAYWPAATAKPVHWLEDEITPVHHEPYVRIANVSDWCA